MVSFQIVDLEFEILPLPKVMGYHFRFGLSWHH